MNTDELQEILDLARRGMKTRAIARKLGRDPKTIRRALGRPPVQSAMADGLRAGKRPPPPGPKLDPFKDRARELHAQGLFAPRILRELKAKGYTGSLTLLKDFLRSLGPHKEKPRKVFRRFETKIALESQVDWSPYRLTIGGREVVAHCFSLILAWCRRLWIGFFRNERLPTLLWAHVEAFRYHDGLTSRIVYDNQTTVTLGRVGGKPLWNPAFLEFAKFHGFEPWAARPKDAPRKGKVERPFQYIESDLLRGTTFDSWDDLNQKARLWLDTVANARVHATTARRIDEAYAEEQPLLIRLPSTPFPTERREVRKVQKDGYLPIDGSFYPVPAPLVGQWATVRIHPHHVEILDAAGKVAARHPVPDRPTRIPAAPRTDGADGGPSVRHEVSVSRTVIETVFLARFPWAADFLDGLKRRMNALTPIHLRQIERLVLLYGVERVGDAIRRARDYRNFNAEAVKRILEAAHPNVVQEPDPTPLSAGPEALAALDDLDVASPEDYTLDTEPPAKEDNDDPKE